MFPFFLERLKRKRKSKNPYSHRDGGIIIAKSLWKERILKKEEPADQMVYEKIQTSHGDRGLRM
jgi:hypothetical protein